ncbi:MAG: EF-hand domain-containing protein [Syntrophorhabdaceae bacterium]|nr:EF-hand domain-containing protein [Syntrophorhabdaceae bacterium]
MINTDSNIITLRVGGMPVSLDISNPSLTGYRNSNDIKIGDWVKLFYPPSGVRIIKSSKQQSGIKQPEMTEEKIIKKKKHMARMPRPRTQGNSFRDVDNNKDGRITPVELSVVMPGLTMERFRGYDKNNDGYLDASEYMAAIKNR